MSLPATGARPLILLGAGGHAKVLLALARAAGLVVKGLCDPALAKLGTPDWQGLPVLGGDEFLERLGRVEAGLINGIGQTVGSTLRRQLFERLAAQGFAFPALVHPAAWVAPEVALGQGVQVMAGAIVQPDCRIGENTIINTRASVDHDGRIGKHVHLAPAATLCGGVQVADGVFVGTGATLVQGLSIGAGAVVGAGVTLLRDLPAGARVLGAPARFGLPATP